MQARIVQARNVQARNVQARNVLARNVQARNMQERNVQARNLQARNVQARNVQARNVQARNLQDAVCASCHSTGSLEGGHPSSAEVIEDKKTLCITLAFIVCFLYPQICNMCLRDFWKEGFRDFFN